MLKKYGYARVAAIVNKIELGNVKYNIEEMKRLLLNVNDNGVDIAVFPELSICGYSVQDMFLNENLYDACIDGLAELKEFSKNINTTFIVGTPIKVTNSLYNCAVSISNGSIIGITPKTYIPNYNEFYENRYFSSAERLTVNKINLLGEEVAISNMLCYKCNNFELTYAVDICEDLWMNNSPSNFTSFNGANVIFNLSASNETAGKAKYRRNLVYMQASKCVAAYIYASSGIWESTSDILFSGHAIIAEPDGKLIENDRLSFESSILMQDVDVHKINSDRIKKNSYGMMGINKDFYEVSFNLKENNNLELLKRYKKMPFVPNGFDELEEILNIQATALAKRIKHLGNSKMVIGISGGSDSTLAYLVCLRTCKLLNLPNSHIIAITMPGFGTTNRTYENAKNLIMGTNADVREISIKEACIKHFSDINHDYSKHDITYENAQARERTQILFDIANKEKGIVIGTGDLSELALGWATYNGDHMANYNVNSSIPKTLVTRLIKHVCDTSEGILKTTLEDILATPVSPELLPPDENDNITQVTENTVGPYILHDFFLYHFMSYGASIKKIYFLACNVFKDDYDKAEIKRVLSLFIKRFFTQQFKRNCVCDGVKVGDISLSPRGDLRLSSEMYYNVYQKELDEL
ncbi:MAG: NAD(+) synthase [Acholeplasmatales bacterium]|nr:NAD(+) synthase [Acholeplasmatales bacterium]